MRSSYWRCCISKDYLQLKNSDLEIVLSDESKEYLATEGYNKEFGARPLRRSIQRLLEDPLSEELLKGKYKAGSTIIVSLNEKEGKLDFESVEAPNEPEVDFADSDSWKKLSTRNKKLTSIKR